MSPGQVFRIQDDIIPEGKVISTIHGGPNALELSMEKLKKYEFSGYILIRVDRHGYVSEGYLVLKDGDLEAAIYGRRVDGKYIVTGKGQEGLKLAWGDSYDVLCDLEVHGRLDVNVILQNFPLARINEPKREKVQKRRTRFSLEWGNNRQGETEVVADESDPDLPETLREKLNFWQSKGYIVKQLQDEIARNPAGADQAFEQFEGNIRRTEFLMVELESMDGMRYGSDVERIRAMMRNPAKIMRIEAEIQGLKVKIEQEKVKERDLAIAELMTQTKPPEPPPAPPEQKPEARVEEMQHIRDVEATPPPHDEAVEEKLAGQGDILPPQKSSGDGCTVCGAELHGRIECSTCGAENVPSAADSMAPIGDSNLVPGLTFDNFIPCEANRFSHSAALAVSRPSDTNYNPLFICSSTGLGKTHLLNAIGNYVLANYPDKKVLYMSLESFANEYAEASKGNRKKQFKKKFRDLDFLLLDDINLIVGHDEAQDELYHTLSALFKDGKQVVITCNGSVRDTPGIKERLVSLFDSGLPTDMDPPDLDTRLQILRKKATDRKIMIGEDVLRYIADRYRKNVRTMDGALKKLTAFSSLMNVPINLETAKQALKDEPEEPIEQEEVQQIIPMAASEVKLKMSHSYLIEEERPVKCFQYFVDNLNRGMAGLALTRVNPKRLREQYDLGGSTVLWLTDKEGDAENRVMPVLERIIYRIEDFLNSQEKPAILLIDGLDYLVSNNNFDSVLKFLRRLIDEVSESDAIFITSITPETIDEQGLNILEREMEIISFLQTTNP